LNNLAYCAIRVAPAGLVGDWDAANHGRRDYDLSEGPEFRSFCRLSIPRVFGLSD
jgi:hypothetical protein